MRAAGGDPAGREIRVSLENIQVGRVGVNNCNLAKILKPGGVQWKIIIKMFLTKT